MTLPPVPGLLRFFALNDISGEAVPDSTGHADGWLGSNATAPDTKNPTIGTNPACLRFDGSGQYARFPANGLPAGSSADVTMFAAFRADGTAAQVAISYGASTNVAGASPNIQALSATQLRWAFAGDTLDMTVTGGVQGKPMFAVARYRASDRQQRLDVFPSGDGAMRTAGTGLNFQTVLGTLGVYCGGLNVPFNGEIYFAGICAGYLSDADRDALWSWAQTELTARGVLAGGGGGPDPALRITLAQDGTVSFDAVLPGTLTYDRSSGLWTWEDAGTGAGLTADSTLVTADDTTRTADAD
jgi:hypothetical protein